MRRRGLELALVLAVVAALAVWFRPEREQSPVAAPTDGYYRGLIPQDVMGPPPFTRWITVEFSTEAGAFVVEVYPEAAPRAAARFVELVEADFYSGTPLVRVIPGFVAQFGINPKGDFPKWKEAYFEDDPTLFKLEPGTIAFAKAGPDTNSTQVFINYVNNDHLREQGYTPFGRVVAGMDVVERFPAQELDQGKLWDEAARHAYFQETAPEMLIIQARVR